jgi:hypothetical protein
MAIRKRTVITEETHEVWIIRTGNEEVIVSEPSEATRGETQEVKSNLALEPMDEEA